MEIDPETMTNSVTPELTCINTIAPEENWIVIIGRKKYSLDYLKDNKVWNRRTKFDVTNNIYVSDKRCVLNDINSLIFYHQVDLGPLDHFNMMQELCVNNCQYLYGLAEKLSGRSVEIIFKHIFQKEGISLKFVELFFTVFFPAYLSRNYNWFSLSLLVRARVAYPSQFYLLIHHLIRDLGISNSVLLDYAGTLDKEKTTELMKVLSRWNMTHIEFCHNIKLLCHLFTNCDIDEDIFSYIFVHMEFNANYCAINKDYGKLLLTLLKVYPDFGGSDDAVRDLVERHGSPYKPACEAILHARVVEIMRLQNLLLAPARPRFFIPQEQTQSLL